MIFLHFRFVCLNLFLRIRKSGWNDIRMLSWVSHESQSKHYIFQHLCLLDCLYLCYRSEMALEKGKIWLSLSCLPWERSRSVLWRTSAPRIRESLQDIGFETLCKSSSWCCLRPMSAIWWLRLFRYLVLHLTRVYTEFTWLNGYAIIPGIYFMVTFLLSFVVLNGYMTQENIYVS